MSNKSPMRGPKSFGGFHLPTVAVPPSDRRRSTFGDRLGSLSGDLAMWAAVPRPVGSASGARCQLRLRFLMPNRSPTRWPKVVGRFHLPSAVCPPSVFGETPSGRVWQQLEALVRARRAKLHDTQSTSRGPKLVGGFRLPTDVRPPSGRLLHLRATLGARSGLSAANLAARSASLSAFRQPSALGCLPPIPWSSAGPSERQERRTRQCCTRWT